MRSRVMLLAALALLIGCRGRPRSSPSDPVEIARVVDSLRPSVERAVGQSFSETPRSAMVSKEEVRRFIMERMEQEFPPVRRAGVEAAYSLLGLLPDTLNLDSLLLAIYSEQVAGYYDPQSRTLYGVHGADPTQLRLILAHELVHALQHESLPLDSILVGGGDGDRTAAAQAVLEGHATLASTAMLSGDPGIVENEEFWNQYREQVLAGQQQMPVFARAPLILRERLIFPYLAGAEFMRWWKRTRGSPLPSLEQLPASTEQVLHPDRYPADLPGRIEFADSSADVMMEETLGELEIHVLLASFIDLVRAAYDAPLGWKADRLRVYRTPGGPALVWYSLWDGEPQAARFHRNAQAGFQDIVKPGYRVDVSRVTHRGGPGVRVVHAPEGWGGWKSVPAIREP